VVAATTLSAPSLPLSCVFGWWCARFSHTSPCPVPLLARDALILEFPATAEPAAAAFLSPIRSALIEREDADPGPPDWPHHSK